jgi:hypothetical protein
MPPKAIHQRERSECELKLYAQYTPHREQARPRRCNQGGEGGLRPCWVRDGPPSIDNHTLCLGCSDSPVVPAAMGKHTYSRFNN